MASNTFWNLKSQQFSHNYSICKKIHFLQTVVDCKFPELRLQMAVQIVVITNVKAKHRFFFCEGENEDTYILHWNVLKSLSSHRSICCKVVDHTRISLNLQTLTVSMLPALILYQASNSSISISPLWSVSTVSNAYIQLLWKNNYLHDDFMRHLCHHRPWLLFSNVDLICL